MTKQELLSRLEAIQMQMNEVEQMIKEKSMLSEERIINRSHFVGGNKQKQTMIKLDNEKLDPDLAIAK
ncbi:hypothetical protein MUB24_00930 [Lederbergia sp. NSJ-179]|uniref:hypothetical protein n=1 Tax=Lederbergia sp. NSJ-179 TaxID=2931402 RepID=UPI001FD2E83F|nr:hypothetical protein [Lederbergia sp. NSJ-179]MCJ7839492.1 hypothetical protein [Lederbergia sp. NSJ-179]